MEFNPLKLGDITASIPIIQGGMGIGVSRSNLASAVANEGGIGIISAVQIGFEEPDFKTNNKEANKRALCKEIKTTRSLSKNGILGMNILAAATHYKDLIKTAVENKIDLIISGAGLPVDLPLLVKETKTKIIPIVSSGKAASVISKLWSRKYNRIPDGIIVEGPLAGGHLGFSNEDLITNKFQNLDSILKDVLTAVQPYESKFKKKIPIIAAGGIFDGNDIAKYLKLGASGVQMATRFVATEECDAHINFKKAYINASQEDICLVKSPVGMPGRAIMNNFLSNLSKNNIKVSSCYNCLKSCNPASTPYCITDALINAVNGNIENGLIFAGSNASKLNKIVTVKELMAELTLQLKKA